MAILLSDSYKVINWDLDMKSLDTKYWGKVTDSGRGCKVALLQNGVLKTPSTETMRVNFKKPSGLQIFIDGVISGNYFVFDFTEQVFAEQGEVMAELMLNVGGEWLMSSTFYIQVDQSFTSAIESSEELTALQTALSDADNFKTQILDVVTNYAKKDEVTNVMTPKGNIAYASLPTTGNTVGWYYYCSDGDGINGKGNYVWNGTSWYFGGTGDEGYNILKKQFNYELGVVDNFALTGKATDGYMYNPSTGIWSVNSSIVTTDKFEIGNERIIKTSIDTGFVVLFDNDKNFISASTTTASPRSYAVTNDTAKYCAIMYIKSGYTYANIVASTVSGLIIRDLPAYSDVVSNVSMKETIEVGVGKTYTTLLSALEYASSIKDKQIIINVFAGEYNLYTELGGDGFVSGLSSSAKWSDVQPVLEGNVIINGIGNVVFKLEIPTSTYNSYKTQSQILSILNSRGSIQVNNISFITANNRYAIHDECDDISGYEDTIHKLTNCRFYGNNSIAAIGTGASSSEYIVDKCYINNTWNGFYLHGWGTQSGASLSISDTIILASNHGINLGVNSLSIANVKISNTYVGPDIYVFSEKPATYTNNIFRIIGSNNNINNVSIAPEITSSEYAPVLLNW